MKKETYFQENGQTVASIDCLVPNLFEGMLVTFNSASRRYSWRVLSWSFDVSSNEDEASGLIVKVEQV